MRILSNYMFLAVNAPHKIVGNSYICVRFQFLRPFYVLLQGRP